MSPVLDGKEDEAAVACVAADTLNTRKGEACRPSWVHVSEYPPLRRSLCFSLYTPGYSLRLLMTSQIRSGGVELFR